MRKVKLRKIIYNMTDVIQLSRGRILTLHYTAGVNVKQQSALGIASAILFGNGKFIRSGC
jgi:hypothetical protein